MSLEDELHQLVLTMEGVSTVYSADPLWMNVLKQVGALLGPEDDDVPTTFVVCSEEGRPASGGPASGGPGRTLTTVRVRIGTSGAQPAPVVAKLVAEGIRAHVCAQRPDAEVKAVVEIAAIGL